MADDPKGIYFAPNNQGFATILPDRKDPNAMDFMERGMMQKAAQRSREQKQRQKDLEKIKGFDTYRYYLPATTEMTNDLIGYVSQEEYNPAELQRRVALYTQLSQAQMQMKDFDEVTFKEYDDDPRILDNAKEAYIGKYREDASMEGLLEAAKQTPDKAWFTKEVGGSQLINTNEAFRENITSPDGTFSEWLSTTEEGEMLLRGKYGYAVQQWSKEKKKSKAKAFARFDEATGSIVAMNPDELIQANVLSAFQDDPFTNRIIEDRAIAAHKERGLEGPVPDETRAEVLREILTPYAAAGEATQETEERLMRDYYPSEGERSRKVLGQRLYDKFESLMDKDGLPGDRDPLFRGMEFNDYKLGDVVLEHGGPVLEYEEKETPIDPSTGEPMIGVDAVFTKKRAPLTMDMIYKVFGEKIASKFEGIAYDKGRIDDRGNFIYKREPSDYTDQELKEMGYTEAQINRLRSQPSPQTETARPRQQAKGGGPTTLSDLMNQ